jgi:hypothetical protein
MQFLSSYLVSYTAITILVDVLPYHCLDRSVLFTFRAPSYTGCTVLPQGPWPTAMSSEVGSQITLQERFNSVLHYYEDSSDDLDLLDLPKSIQDELKVHLETTVVRLISWSVDVQIDSGGLSGIEDNSLGLAVELRLWELEELLRDFLQPERSATTLLLAIGHNLPYC